MQNVHTQIFNTAARRSKGGCECSDNPPPGGNTTAIFRGVDLGLNDVAAHDYRPSASSPLLVRQRVFGRHSIDQSKKDLILPRQARDKPRERLKKDPF